MEIETFSIVHTHTHTHTGDHREKKGTFTGYYVVLTDDLLPYYRAATPMSPARAQWRDGRTGARERTGVRSEAKRGETHTHVTEKGYVRGLLECVRGMCVLGVCPRYVCAWSVSEVCVCLECVRGMCVLGVCPRYVCAYYCAWPRWQRKYSLNVW